MMRRYLQVQPSDLKFPFELNKLSACSMKLINKTDQDVAFKVKTTHPKKYCVRPNLAVIPPGSTCLVEVLLQAQKVAPIGVPRKDKFLVQSIVAQDGENLKVVTSDMFSKEMRKDLQEYRLRVVFVNANPPSPIPEASEEESSSEASELENSDIMSRRSSLSNERAVIFKLTEETSTALTQNRKLQCELEILRRQQRRGSVNRLTLICWILIIAISLLAGYVFG